jgi:hypothetical protein
MAKFLRHKEDGTIYDWNPILAKNPMCEEVTEEQAYPERFMTPKQKGRKAKVNLATELPEEPDFTPPELAAEAAKGFPE